MQYSGNMSRCWMFTALASKIIVSLNYHNITNVHPGSEIEESIHACVYTCYYFDKTLSLLLLRPPSLPDLKVLPTQLIHIDPDLPTSALITGVVEYSELKHALLNILLDTKKMDDKEKANILSDLVARAHQIRSNMQQVRQNHRHYSTITHCILVPPPSRRRVCTIMELLTTRVVINGLQTLLHFNYNHPSTFLRPQISLGL